MAAGVSLRAQRRNVYGATVERAAQVIPATGNVTLFTVAGGRVVVTYLIGEVTTVMSATATNAKLTSVSTAIGGAGTDICANTAVTSLAVGNEFSPTAIGSAAQTGAVVTQNNEIVIPAGIIRLTTDATNTGAMRWTLLYLPLDDGATVTAA
jgi:hypothetical protein